MKLYSLLCVSLLFLLPIRSNAETWDKADLYLMNWSTDTRATVTIDQLRKWADYRRHVTARGAFDIAVMLKLDALKKSADTRAQDARFVVDFSTEKGAKITYYASYFNLCSADNKRRRSIDENFRKHIDALMKYGKS